MNMPSRALFLDRDGVINVEKNYVYRIEDFEFIDGIFELCALAQNRGFKLIVITNQAGIGRGYYTETDFQHLTNWMLNVFRERGIVIDRVYHCPYHPTAGIGEYRRESFDRKPNPGMILKARKDFDLDLPQCVLIGDKDSDIEAGWAAGVGHLIKLSFNLLPVENGVAHGVLELSNLEATRGWLDSHSIGDMDSSTH
jgi:D-glycero-D-manno-heptose 1,7-bisphosphate phosphatase